MLATATVRQSTTFAGYGRIVRGSVEMHLRMVGLLLAAGPDGMPLAMLGRTLYPYLSPRLAYNSAMRLIDKSGPVPISQDSPAGRVTVYLDGDAYAAMMRALGIPVDAATLASDDGC